MSRDISENVKRQLYAESMGRCMNPACKKVLFRQNGDIIEKAHIDPYCKTADNSFENLVILCPNCHTDFDENSAFSPEEVLGWKRIRKQELDSLFGERFATFDDLKDKVVPLLSENKTIYEQYYLKDNKKLWDKFAYKILINNRKLKTLFQNNLGLFQHHSIEAYSNLALINGFLLHVDEFEITRADEEKTRGVLFPPQINSIFGIQPVRESLSKMTESLECLIVELIAQERFAGIFLGIADPYILLIDNTRREKVFLNDGPRLRQLFHDNNCFKANKFKLDSLNYVLLQIKKRNISFSFLNNNCLREIILKGKKVIFVYEYCLSEAGLASLAPERNSIVVNLQGFNGECCISREAYSYAVDIGVKLLTTRCFLGYINGLSLQE